MVNKNIGLHRTKIDSRLFLQHYAAKTLNAASQNKVFNEFRTSVCVCVIIIDILIRFFVWFRRRINVTFYELWRMAKIYCVKTYIKRIWLAKCSDDETMHKQHVTSNQRIDSMTNITNSLQYFQRRHSIKTRATQYQDYLDLWIEKIHRHLDFLWYWIGIKFSIDLKFQCETIFQIIWFLI